MEAHLAARWPCSRTRSPSSNLQRAVISQGAVTQASQRTLPTRSHRPTKHGIPTKTTAARSFRRATHTRMMNDRHLQPYRLIHAHDILTPMIVRGDSGQWRAAPRLMIMWFMVTAHGWLYALVCSRCVITIYTYGSPPSSHAALFPVCHLSPVRRAVARARRVPRGPGGSRKRNRDARAETYPLYEGGASER